MSDVIVVGARPTGLLLAGDLAEAGVAVTVLERRSGELSNMTRALIVHARTLEQFDARGLADPLLATSAAQLSALRMFGHMDIDLARLPSRFPFLALTGQYNIEGLLQKRAAEAVRTSPTTARSSRCGRTAPLCRSTREVLTEP